MCASEYIRGQLLASSMPELNNKVTKFLTYVTMNVLFFFSFNSKKRCLGTRDILFLFLLHLIDLFLSVF